MKLIRLAFLGLIVFGTIAHGQTNDPGEAFDSLLDQATQNQRQREKVQVPRHNPSTQFKNSNIKLNTAISIVKKNAPSNSLAKEKPTTPTSTVKTGGQSTNQAGTPFHPAQSGSQPRPTQIKSITIGR